MQHQTNINSDHNDTLQQQQQQHLHKRTQDQEQEEQEHLSSLLLMQTRRRQKTLSSISNFVPLHILLNQPRGVSFSLTVPKSFTIEQLARQIEAEYAYLVEREVGYSRFPVIECGALFDHVELPRRRRVGGKKTNDCSNIRTSGSRKPSQEYCEEDEEEYENDEDEDEENEDDHAGESVVDERDEAESRGVQLRFSDRVEDVLERDSTVHVVNIDQASCYF
ncbi:hypothetical protein BGX24_005907 [Mortierella sp. AD032]|nr:hypothetical protein BGX24_005907 [Mortierella sp. AD032]